MSDMDEAEDRSTMEEDMGLEEVVRAPSLYTRPAFYRQTRKRGKIIKTVSER
jgi:tRNA splicing endonuclease